MSGPSERRIVTFRLGADLFAADIRSVERVLRYEAPRLLPGLPDWIEGVVEYAGRVVPVLDLRRRFGLAASPLTSQTRVLVFTSAEEWVGAIVDAVLDVRALDPDDLAPPPAFFRGLAGEYLVGLARRDQGLVVVIDVNRLLASRDPLSLETGATVSTDG
jgi:purine-binding chemotaxis protein CheW